MPHELTYRNQQIARLAVAGNSQVEIARILNLHKSTVCRLLRDPLVLQEVNRLQQFADVNAVSCVPGIPEKIREGAYQGMDVLIGILADARTDPEMLKLKSTISLELLNRAGFSAIKQIRMEQASMSVHFTAEEIEKIKLDAIAAGARLIDRDARR